MPAMDYKRVLVFGAHPDDELTMAGAMGKMACTACDVTVAIYTDGCEGYPSPEMAETIVQTRRLIPRTRSQATCSSLRV